MIISFDTNKGIVSDVKIHDSIKEGFEYVGELHEYMADIMDKEIVHGRSTWSWCRKSGIKPVIEEHIKNSKYVIHYDNFKNETPTQGVITDNRKLKEMLLNDAISIITKKNRNKLINNLLND